MIIDFAHYRQTGVQRDYKLVALGCEEYFNRKREQLVDFLLNKSKSGTLNAKDKKQLHSLLKQGH